MCSIKDGDVALFVNDSYGNYLALAFDKIYYLNDGSVQKLNDLSSMGKLMLSISTQPCMTLSKLLDLSSMHICHIIMHTWLHL